MSELWVNESEDVEEWTSRYLEWCVAQHVGVWWTKQAGYRMMQKENKTITQAGSDQVNMKIVLKAASHHFRWVNDVEKTGGNPGVVLPQEMSK